MEAHTPTCHKAGGVKLPYPDTRHPETDLWSKPTKNTGEILLCGFMRRFFCFALYIW